MGVLRAVRCREGAETGGVLVITDGCWTECSGSLGQARPGVTCTAISASGNSVYRQFRRWTLAGTWEVMLEALNEAGAGHGSVQMIDSTIIRAQQHAAGV